MASYLQIENLSKSYGEFVMFENFSFQLSKGQKVAIVARNGAGKTTLFNILCGDDISDGGSVIFHKDITVGFLRQDPPFNPSLTVLEQVLDSSGKVKDAVQKYGHAMASGNEELMHKAVEQMDALQAWDFEAKMKRILGQLKIFNLEQKMNQLSGGQRKRVALANVLLQNPDLLILDEPTNHLDLDMIEWLEEYLQTYCSTLLMVTHDRYFLDRVCNEILEIDNKQVFHYKGNYSYFLEKRAERLEIEQVNIDKARNLYRKELEWIRRMPQARGTKAKYRVDAFEDVKEQAFKQKSNKEININFQGSRLGAKVIDAEHVSKKFGSLNIINDFSYKFAAFEKIGVIGPNGTGKTTLLNLLTGSLKPDNGIVEHGETLKIGYYRQDGLNFNEQMKVIDVAQEVAEVVTMRDGNQLNVSQLLNMFLFPPPVQHSFIYKLSGGEKRRLYLMTILMQNPNFLILDEPTNDLDIVTLNILEEYLQQFKGCVLIVSHDRYFMDKLVDHVFVFEGNGVIRDFPGNYSDYREYKLANEQIEEPKVKKDAPQPTMPKATSRPKKLSYQQQREFDALTVEIEKLESEKKELEIALASGALNNSEVIEKSNRFSEVCQQIDAKTERWMELSELA
ncbi:MAG TPA: ABC-F family ATP-binding cassette domain-containing protein [Bacteroidales bacterium]